MSNNAKIREEAKNNIRALLISSPVGLSADELKRDIKSIIGAPIPFRTLGYNCLEDFLNDITDVISINWRNGIMFLRALPDSSTRHLEKLISNQKLDKKKWAATRPVQRSRPLSRRHPPTPRHVPWFLRQQVSQLCKSYPHGLHLSDFDSAFSRRFGSHLDFCRLGYSAMKDLLCSLSDIVYIKQLPNGGSILVPASYIDAKQPHDRHKIGIQSCMLFVQVYNGSL